MERQREHKRLTVYESISVWLLSIVIVFRRCLLILSCSHKGIRQVIHLVTNLKNI